MNTQNIKIQNRNEVNKLSEIYESILNEYKQYLLDKRLREKSVVSYIGNTKPFLVFMMINNIKIPKLTKNDIYNYINTLNHYSIVTKTDRLYCVRYFLDYLYVMKLTHFNGHNALPKIVSHHDTTLTSYYSIDEITILLNSIDTSTPKGNRDYLIICLIVYLGLRTSDIINLKFENIDFENNVINIIQHKTNKPLSLPLIDDVKYPLLDYIKNYRSKSDSNYIFLSVIPPFNELKGRNLKNDVTRYLKTANITIGNRKHGPHALRHSLSNSLLKENVPLEVISEILGHRNISATQKYISIDLKKLKVLSLEVPPIC